MVSEYYRRPRYHLGDERDFGLSLILDALDAALSPNSPKLSPA